MKKEARMANLNFFIISNLTLSSLLNDCRTTPRSPLSAWTGKNLSVGYPMIWKEKELRLVH